MGIDKILADIFQGPAGFYWAEVGIVDIIRILLDVVKLLLILGNVTAAVLIVWNSYGYINAYGNEEKVKSAKKSIMYIVLGVIIITLSYLMVSLLYTGLTGEKPPSEIINPPV